MEKERKREEKRLLKESRSKTFIHNKMCHNILGNVKCECIIRYDVNFNIIK